MKLKKSSKWINLAVVSGMLIIATGAVASCSVSGQSKTINKNIKPDKDTPNQPLTLSDELQIIDHLNYWQYPNNINNYINRLHDIVYDSKQGLIDRSSGLINDLTSSEHINLLASEYKKANPKWTQNELDSQIKTYKESFNLLYLQFAPDVISYWYSILRVVDYRNYQKWNLDQWIVGNNEWLFDLNLNRKYNSIIQDYYLKNLPIPLQTKTQLAEDINNYTAIQTIESLIKFTNYSLNTNSTNRLTNQYYMNYNYYALLIKIHEISASDVINDRTYLNALPRQERIDLGIYQIQSGKLINEISSFKHAYTKYWK